MTMMPCDVVTAHDEYSLCPRKYKLSNTFAGSVYQVLRAGGPGWRGAGGAAGCRVCVRYPQVTLKPPWCSLPAAFRAASIWTWAAALACGCDCASPMVV